MKEESIIVFDVETQKTFDEVGGRDHFDKLGISYAGVYSYTQEKYFGFFEKDLPQLEKIMLSEQPLLVGFNSIHFDIPVLQPYFPSLDLTTLPHVDILKDIEAVLGHRLKLDSVASATLYESKSGDGLDAIRWYRSGDFDSLAKYCIDDVKVTHRLYEYGKRHGKIYYFSGGQKVPIAVKWSTQQTIESHIMSAFKKHEQVVIEYFFLDEKEVRQEKKMTVDILSYNGADAITGFSHEDQQKIEFSLSQIWDIETTGQHFAHQAKLF